MGLPIRSGKKALEYLTIFYMGAAILCQELRMCYFAYHFLPLTKLLHHAEAFMIWAGLVLTALNILFGTGWRKSRRVFLLYGICLLDATASFRAAGGLEPAWQQRLKCEIGILVLFYCAAQSVRADLLGRLLHRFYWFGLLFWSMMCCLSLCQFALMIGIDGTRIASFPPLKGLGYYGHRLYGTFNTLEYGTVTSLMIMLAGGYWFVKTHIRAERILLALCNVPLLFYLVLSGSRNAQLALYLSLFLGAGIVCFKSSIASRILGKKRLMAMMVALAVVAVAHLGYIAIQRAAERVPELFSDYSGFLARDSSVQDPSVDESEGTSDGEAEPESRLLERIDTKGDISTNRFSIWKDYIGLWREYGPLGLSSTYDSRYIQEHHPDLFICEYIRETNPEGYAMGRIYHPHNGYLKILISTGYLGFAFLMVFLFGSVKDVWKAIRGCEKIRPELLFSLMMVAAGCSSAMFDLELFFVFNPISYLFWLALGVLMKQAGEGKKVETAEMMIK